MEEDDFFGEGFARYRSHKVVEAAAIRAAEFNADGSGRVAISGGIMVGNALCNAEIVDVPVGFQRKPGDLLHAMENGGAVLVRYDDGYLSWSPRSKFTENYTREN